MSIDKLNDSSLNDTFDRAYIVRILLLLVVVVGILIGGLMYLNGAEKPNGDESFDLRYSDSGIIIEQTNGEPVRDNVEVQFNYYDGETSSKSVSVSELDSPDIVIPSREIYEIDYVEVNWVSNGKIVETFSVEQLPDEYSVDEPKVEVSDVKVRSMETVELNASEYVSSDLNIVSYDWSVTAGPKSDSESIAVEFSDEGTYAGELTVEDEMGNEVTDSFSVTVQNPTLIDKDSIDRQLNVGESIVLDSTEFTTTEATDYKWIVGAEEFDQPVVQHTFSDSGVQSIELVAEDSFGYKETSEYQVFVAQNIDPTLSVDSQDGRDVDFSVQTSYDSIESYTWSFGDGNQETTQDSKVSHTYDSSGTYTASVSMTTESGQNLVEETSVEVSSRNSDSDSVEIEMDSGLGNAWTVQSVNGDTVDSVLGNDDIGDQNPSMYLEEGQKYTFSGLSTDHPIVFRDMFGDPVLSQSESTDYEDKPNVEWDDNGSSVSFVFTEDVSELIEGYESSENSMNMDGTIFVTQ